MAGTGPVGQDQQEVVVLKIWGELTFQEIADTLDISGNTAASRYRYALEKLRDLLNEMVSDDLLERIGEMTGVFRETFGEWNEPEFY